MTEFIIFVYGSASGFERAHKTVIVIMTVKSPRARTRPRTNSHEAIEFTLRPFDSAQGTAQGERHMSLFQQAATD
jgi:hypothetical protein